MPQSMFVLGFPHSSLCQSPTGAVITGQLRLQINTSLHSSLKLRFTVLTKDHKLQEDHPSSRKLFRQRHWYSLKTKLLGFPCGEGLQGESVTSFQV